MVDIDIGEDWYDPTTKSNGSKNWVNLEESRVGELYALTINPPKDDNVYGKAYLLTAVETMLCRVNTLQYSYIELWPEMSPAGRLHFHGHIIIEDIFGFYTHDILRIATWGNFKMCKIDNKPVKSYRDWLSYCLKQEKVMRPAFEGIGLKYRCVNTLLKSKEIKRAL